MSSDDEGAVTPLVEDAPVGRPLRKRAKRADPAEIPNAVRRRRKRIWLNMLPDMPLDIIMEIFGHVQPVDLLSLARSSKTLRSLLMHRSAMTIWKAARGNVPDLPDCPACLSEPAYAALMFSCSCTFCGKSPIRDIDWECLSRCCPECRQNPKQFTDISSWGFTLQQTVKAILPHIVRSHKLYVRAELLEKMLRCINAGRAMAEEECEEKVVDQLHDLLTKDGWDRTASIPLRDWHLARAAERASQRDELRQQRRTAILDRLAELDLKDEVERMEGWVRDNFDNLPCMKEPKALSDREWEKVKDMVIRFVEDCRRARLQRERTAPYYATVRSMMPVLNTYARSRPHTEILPTLSDFCQHPAIYDMILDISKSKGEVDLAAFRELVPVACEWWREKANRKLVKKLSPSLTADENPDTDLLELATVWFKCEECNNNRFSVCGYPEVLAHDGHRTGSGFNSNPQTPEELVNYVVRDMCIAGLFKFGEFSDKLELAADASATASELVRLCGFDPATARRADMDEHNARFACVECRTMFPWHKAVLHAIERHHREPLRWVLANDADSRAVRALESKDRTRVTKHPLWCLHCRFFQRPDVMNSWGAQRGMAKLKTHLEAQHAITTRPKLGVDYRIHKYPTEAERPRPVTHDPAKLEISTPELVEAWAA